ncbi:Regulation of nuclear pre-mRNA domain-containing protein 1B, partial [Bienertia sinuspersici]
IALSHWCIFHMNKAKLVVETWERQFHSSPREQRLAFLYLANDILQNSRRKGAEFVAEFWRVLPEALRDVIRSGDEFGKNAALRLAAQLRSDQVTNVCAQSVSADSNMLLDERGGKEAHTSTGPPGFNPVERQLNPVVYTRQVPLSDNSASTEDDSRKSAAAAVAAKLTASTASAEMLSHVLTSLVSGVAFGNNSKDSPSEPHHSEKRPKLENESTSYAPPPPPPPPQSQQPPPPLPPFPHPESLQNANSTTSTNQQSTTGEQPPLPSSSPPPLPPLPPMPLYPMTPQFIQTAGSMSNVAYSYGATQQPQHHLSGYPSVGASVTGMSPYATPPANPYQPFPGSDGGFYSPSSSVPMASISRQQTL